MPRLFRPLASVVVAVVATSALSVVALAADPVGPAIGKVKYTTAIQPVGAGADVDDYVGRFVPGESLTVSCKSNKGSVLLPDLALFDPDGIDRTPVVKFSKKGNSASFKKFVVDKAGAWSVRVSGLQPAGGGVTTQGAYTISFKVKKAKPVKLKKQTLGGANPLSVDHLFGGIEGALLDLSIKFSKKEAAVTLDALLDPAGGDVPSAPLKASDDVVVKKTKISLKKLPLASGDGNYVARVGTVGPTATYAISTKLTVLDRVKGGKKPLPLPANEPFLNARVDPLRVAEGQVVRMTGVNLTATGPIRVFFGTFESPDVVEGGAGTFLDVTVPAGTDGTTVSATVQLPDGQGSARDDFFFFAPPPTLTAVQLPTGQAVIGDSTAGGKVVRLIGAGLGVFDTILFADDSVPPDLVLDGNTLEATVPPHAAVVGNVFVRDEFGRDSAMLPFEFKTPPTVDPQPYTPAIQMPNVAGNVQISGSGFEATDRVDLAQLFPATNLVSPTRLDFALPSLGTAQYVMSIIDRVGTRVSLPNLVVQPPPTLTSVTVVAGDEVLPGEISVNGGATCRVAGTNFLGSDTIELDGSAIPTTNRSPTSFDFVAPARAAGTVDIRLVNIGAQEDTLVDALSFLGFSDDTTNRSPGSSTTDDLTALVAAVGDLDGDGDDDDVVIVSPNYYFGNFYLGNSNMERYSNGTGTRNYPGQYYYDRYEYTRIFFGDGNGALVDNTAANFPAAYTDPGGSDEWNATAVAVGDLDGQNGDDILIAGLSTYPGLYPDLRLFTNDGSGTFSHAYDETATAFVPGYYVYYYAYGYVYTGQIYTVTTNTYLLGTPTSIALGDLDGDMDPDVVVGRDHYDQYFTGIDVSYVYQQYYNGSYYAVIAYYDLYYNANYVYVNQFTYLSATQVFENRIGAGYGLVDVTAAALPAVGTDTNNLLPAFHARDVDIGDVDGQDGLDIVLTWDDPTTVSVYGMYGLSYNGASNDVARVATRVLINQADGTFSDDTATWLPAGAAPEFWQGNQIALADFDGDGDDDLAIAVAAGVDTANHTVHALRILRNNSGASDTFTDVTILVLPALSASNDDDFRAESMRIADVNGDGDLDILVGTTEALLDTSGNRIRSTRLLFGDGTLGAGAFRLGNGFLPAATADSGDATGLVLGDLAGSDEPALILVTEGVPTNSSGGESLRVFPWND